MLLSPILFLKGGVGHHLCSSMLLRKASLNLSEVSTPFSSCASPECCRIMQVDGTMFAPKTINPSMCEAVDAGIDGPLKSLIMELAEFAEKNRQKRRDN
mmetsp:Transcript_46917/g.121015  ORF Transcript_46917/g.121015 Transcript_46917/m.121015 type:complete len:99 (+) Transcript_46917:3238-3534(+)